MRPASYKTILGRVCLGGHATGAVINRVYLSFHELCVIAFKTNPVKTLSSETLVWLLSAVAYSDSSTMSQAEVPLEWIHAFDWEMGLFTTQLISFESNSFIVKPNVCSRL